MGRDFADIYIYLSLRVMSTHTNGCLGRKPLTCSFFCKAIGPLGMMTDLRVNQWQLGTVEDERKYALESQDHKPAESSLVAFPQRR